MSDVFPVEDARPRSETSIATLGDLFLLMRRRRLLILTGTLLGTAVAFGLASERQPLYTASTLVEVDPRDAPIKLDAAADSLKINPVTLSTQVNIIRSRKHAARVVEELDLVRDPTFNPPPDPAGEQGLAGLLAPVTGVVDTWLDQWLGRRPAADGQPGPLPEKLVAEEPSEAPTPVTAETLATASVLSLPQANAAETTVGAAPAADIAFEAAIDNFVKRFGASQQGESSLIALSFTHPDPALASTVVNAAADLYVRWQLDEKRQEAERLGNWVGERLARLAEDVQEAETAVEEYRASKGLINDTVDGRFYQQEMSELNSQANRARAEAEDLEAKLVLYRRMQESGDIDALSGVVTSPVLARLREEELGLNSREAELATTLGERHPQMLLLGAEQERLAVRIEREASRLVLDLERETQLARRRLGQIEAELEARRSEGYRLGDAEIGLGELQRQAEANRDLYLIFLERYKEVNEQQDIIEPDVRVVSQAQPPAKPSSLSPKLFTLVGFVSAFSGSTLLALLLEGLNRRARSARQLERLFNTSVLSAVPRVSRVGRNRADLLRYLKRRPRSAYAEALRSLYTTLRLAGGSSPPHSILVASSLSGEGKTTFAASLATTAVQWGQRVVVIDLDLHHPQIAACADVRPRLGIAELVDDDIEIDEVVESSELGFDVIGVAGSPANTAGLIGDERMLGLLEELGGRYDLVVIDSPPILAVSDGRIAARLVDKVIVVARWQKTPLSALRRTLQMLREAHADIAGLALLHVTTRKYMYYENEDGANYSKNLKKYYSEKKPAPEASRMPRQIACERRSLTGRRTASGRRRPGPATTQPPRP